MAPNTHVFECSVTKESIVQDRLEGVGGVALLEEVWTNSLKL